MSYGIKGQGAKLYYATTTTVTSGSAISNINSIDGPGEERNDVDISTLDSSGFREFIPGVYDPGEISVEMNYCGGSTAYTAHTGFMFLQNTLKTNTSTAQYFGVQFNDHTTATSRSLWYCQGYVKSVGAAVPALDDKVTQRVTIKLTGTPVFTGFVV